MKANTSFGSFPLAFRCFVLTSPPAPPRQDVPRYTYANKAGLECFDATWDEFVGMDSTQSTPPVDEDQEVGTCMHFGVWGRLQGAGACLRPT